MRLFRLSFAPLFVLLVVSLLAVEPLRISAEDDEPKRPVKAVVNDAKRAVKKIKKKDRAVVNALRIILNRPQDSNRLPFWRQNELLPGLGYTKIAAGEAYPKWLSLRLMAALRAGHPIEYEMGKELETFFECPVKASVDFADATVELLLLNEMMNRSDAAAEPFKVKAATRAAKIVEMARWPKTFFKLEPTTEQIASLVNELIARRVLISNNWPLPKDFASDRVAKLGEYTLKNEQGEGALWYGIDGGNTVTYADGRTVRNFQDLPRARGILLTLLAHSLAASFSEADQPKHTLKPYITILQSHMQAIAAPNSRTEVEKRIVSGATALFTSQIDESLLLLKDEKKVPKGRLEDIRAAALPEPASIFQVPDPLDIGCAQELGWISAVTLSGAGDANINDHDDRVVRVSLALLAKTGGFFPEKAIEASYDVEEFGEILDGITTLERSETPLTFEERVNRAVSAAADALVKSQDSNGTFPGVYKTYPGGLALCLLALLDADIPRDSPAIRKGIKTLRAQGTLRAPTYAAGIILMMLQKFYEREEEDAGMLDARTPEQYKLAQTRLWKALPGDDRKWIDELVGLLTKNHHEEGWGYSRGTEEAHRDNSNSQYAILGLKAASILGAEFERDVFQKEADRFLADYWASNMEAITVKRKDADGKVIEEDDDKSRAKSKALPKIVPGGWGYIGGKNTNRTLSMSAAGISSIVICRDELKLGGKLTEEQDDNILRHIQGALYHLGINYPYQRPRSLSGLPARSDGFGTFYDMYSVERAGVLAGEEKLKDVQWYFEGANLLIDAQGPDGNWPVMAGSKDYETCNHCFAILFLKRAAIHIADRPRKGPITHGPEKKD